MGQAAGEGESRSVKYGLVRQGPVAIVEERWAFHVKKKKRIKAAHHAGRTENGMFETPRRLRYLVPSSIIIVYRIPLFCTWRVNKHREANPQDSSCKNTLPYP